MFDLAGPDITLRGFAILGSGIASNPGTSAIRVTGHAAVVADNLIGSDAVGSGDPGASARVQAVGMRLLGDDAIVTGNVFAYTPMHGLSIEAGGDNASVTANHFLSNALTGNTQAGIAVRDVGSGLIEGNLIQGSGGNAIELYTFASNLTINANSLLNSGGLPGGEDDAVEIRNGSDNNLYTRNLISSSVGAGIWISNADGNRIGQASQGNQIIGSGGSGVVVLNAGGTRIQGNAIGTDFAGSLVGGNSLHGVDLLSAGMSNTLVGGMGAGEGNLIAHNTLDGVSIDNSAGTGNALLGNRLWANGSLGIDLNDDNLVNANDALDADSGPNNLQNFPVLTVAATNGSTQLTVTGTLNATAISASNSSPTPAAMPAATVKGRPTWASPMRPPMVPATPASARRCRRPCPWAARLAPRPRVRWTTATRATWIRRSSRSTSQQRLRRRRTSSSCQVCPMRTCWPSTPSVMH